jgi:PPOX class probable F420-dependent enzyme
MTLTDADRAMFEGLNYGHLATLMPDGSPQVSPVWVDIEAQTGLILVNTAAGRLKLRNVERDPRVAISVTDSQNQEAMVTVRGRVVQIARDGAEEHIDFLSRKYNGVDFPRHGNRVLLKIEAEHVARDT